MSMGWYPSGKLVILSLPRNNPTSLSVSTPPPPTAAAAQPTASSSKDGKSDCTDAQEQQLLDRFIKWHHKYVLQHEEGAYNIPNAGSIASSAGVHWTGLGVPSTSTTTATLKPSEIFHAVEQRSIADAATSQSTNNNTQKRKTKSRSRRTEMERSERLHCLLQKLDTAEGSGGGADKGNTTKLKKQKNRGVSHKVRTMLLKSHSVGDKRLRMEDRFHLEVFCLSDIERNDEEGEKKRKGANSNCSTRSYRYYSRQTTAGRVASSLAPDLGKDMAVEMLVSYPPPTQRPPPPLEDGHSGVRRRYRRLPNTMTLHDAQCAGWIQEFDVVVVRVFRISMGSTDTGSGIEEDDDKFGLSKSVLDSDSDDDNEDEMIIDDDGVVGDNDAREQGCSHHESSGGINYMAVERDMNDSKQTVDAKEVIQPMHQHHHHDAGLQQRLHTIFQSLNDNSKSKKKPMSKQVRNMLMKSKSVGNIRIRQDDRIYLEVVFFRDDCIDADAASCSSSSYRYFSRETCLHQIIDIVCNSSYADNKVGNEARPSAETIDFIVPCRRKQQQPADENGIIVSYQSLDKSMTLGYAIQNGCIDNFDSVVLRTCINDNFCT